MYPQYLTKVFYISGGAGSTVYEESLSYTRFPFLAYTRKTLEKYPGRLTWNLQIIL